MRFRKELGDLTDLKESIAEHGLMQPIVMNSNGELISGARRVQACLELGIEPDVRVIDFANPQQAEIDENTCRKDFTPQEIYEISQYYNERLSKQGARTDKQTENFGVNDTEVEQPRDVVAKAVHKSTKTLSKINQIFESDCEDVKEKANEGDISVNEAYKQVKKAQKAKETQKARTELAAKAKEVEPSDRWQVFQTDMTVWQNEIQYDFIITDPPYLKEYLHLYEQIAVKAREWLKPDSLLIVMCGQSYLDKIYEMMSKHLTYYWTAAYLTPGQPTPLRQRQVNTVWKPLLIFTNGEYKGKIFSDVFTSDKNEKDFHKWGQSESGMFSIISQVCLPGQFILDPFCGAGTTGVAALKHGCLFHGLEIDTENTKISKARLSEYDNK